MFGKPVEPHREVIHKFAINEILCKDGVDHGQGQGGIGDGNDGGGGNTQNQLLHHQQTPGWMCFTVARSNGKLCANDHKLLKFAKYVCTNAQIGLERPAIHPCRGQ